MTSTVLLHVNSFITRSRFRATFTLSDCVSLRPGLKRDEEIRGRSCCATLPRLFWNADVQLSIRFHKLIHCILSLFSHTGGVVGCTRSNGEKAIYQLLDANWHTERFGPSGEYSRPTKTTRKKKQYLYALTYGKWIMIAVGLLNGQIYLWCGQGTAEQRYTYGVDTAAIPVCVKILGIQCQTWLCDLFTYHFSRSTVHMCSRVVY